MARIFISYRRADADARALFLRQELEREFGGRNVFFDVDTIKPGQDFTRALREAMAETSIFVPVIGPRWLEEVVRRSSNGQDWVREEIEAALADGKVIVPVLVDNAQMPDPGHLPASIRGLAAWQGFAIRHDSVARDVAAFKRELHRLLPRRARAFHWLRRRRTLIAVAAIICFAAGLALYELLRQGPDNAERVALQKQAERRHELAWQAARAMDTPTAYEEFLAQFPHGSRVADAQARRDALRAPTTKQDGAKVGDSVPSIGKQEPARPASASDFAIAPDEFDHGAENVILTLLKFRDWRHLLSTELILDYAASIATADLVRWKDLGFRRPVSWASLAAAGNERGRQAFARVFLTGKVSKADFETLAPGRWCQDCEIALFLFDMSKHSHRDPRFIAAEQISVVLDFMESLVRALPPVVTWRFEVGLNPINPLNPSLLRGAPGDLLNQRQAENGYGRTDRAFTLPVESKGYAIYEGQAFFGINYAGRSIGWLFGDFRNAISEYRRWRCYFKLGLDKRLYLGRATVPMGALESISKTMADNKGGGIIVSLDLRVLRLAVFNLSENHCVLLAEVERVALGDRTGARFWSISGSNLEAAE